MRWGMVRTGLVMAVVIVAAAACSGPHDRVIGTRDPATSYTAEPRVAAVWDVEDVVRTGDPRVLDVWLANLPAEGSPPPCAVQIETTYSDFSSDPTINVKVFTDGREFDQAFPGCALGDRWVSVEAPAPIPTDRRVHADSQVLARHWYPQPDGTLARCALPTCDPATGLPPEPQP